MPIPNYNGSTFVAYVDISGFKEMMKKEKEAIKALDSFYREGYMILSRNTNVHGLFISNENGVRPCIMHFRDKVDRFVRP